MKKITFCAAVIAALVMLFGTLNAQSEYGKAAAAEGNEGKVVGSALQTMPETAPRAEGFVPEHWKIFDRADGDLNGDGVTDTAMILAINEKDTKYVEKLKKMSENETWYEGLNMIVVVDSRMDGKLHFDTVNYKIGEMPGGALDEFKVSIKKHVLDVLINSGGQLRIMETYHFRGDGPNGTGFLTLIGYDEDHYPETVTNDASTKYSFSENYLTNTRIDTTFKMGKVGYVVGTEKRTKINPSKVLFEQATSKFDDK